MKLWVLEYSNGVVQIYVTGGLDAGQTARTPKNALKFNSAEEALQFRKERPHLKFYEPVEHEFDFEQQSFLGGYRG